MATGDQSDMFDRFRALLPRGWFGDDSPFLDALVQGYAKTLNWMYQLYSYAVLQTRIRTSTGGWLDLVANDYFGDRIHRKAGQSDESFLNTIIINLFRERGTRKAISSVLYDLTGRYPDIIEPSRPSDCGGYGVMGGYGCAGAYGSLQMPYQAFVTAYRPTDQGVPYVAGYGISSGGYGQASYADYASSDSLTGVTDDDIIKAIESVKLYGTTIWMRISS